MRQTQKTLKSLQNRFHSTCVVCGEKNPSGMKLPFRLSRDGSVSARFFCSQLLQGYPGLMHGGVIAAILDGAMVNCLFAHGKTAVTASLTVRFLFPVVSKKPAVIKAWIKRANSPLHLVESALVQNRRVVARATAKFMECSEHFLKQNIITA